MRLASRRCASSIAPGSTLILRRVQRLPTVERDDDATRNAQHRQRDAEELEHVRADINRRVQNHEAVDRNPTREVRAHHDAQAFGCGQEHERAADRVDDCEQRGKCEQEERHRTPRACWQLLRYAIVALRGVRHALHRRSSRPWSSQEVFAQEVVMSHQPIFDRLGFTRAELDGWHARRRHADQRRAHRRANRHSNCATSATRSRARLRRFGSGDWFPRRVVANWCACSATNCARPSTTSARWSRSSPARSCRRVSARCRR